MFVLMGASICSAAAEAGTQFTVFALDALKKQLPIFIFSKFRVTGCITAAGGDRGGGGLGVRAAATGKPAFSVHWP